MDLDVPLPVRAEFAHAAVQSVADELQIDVLHVKGAALDRSLAWPGRTGDDADLLVRPGHIERLLAALVGRGWIPYDTFATGSPFSHSQTLHHAAWGYADIHRIWPGFGPDPARAFEQLWRNRQPIALAGRACAAPRVEHQALILLTHAARSPGSARAARDVAQVWRVDPDWRDLLRRAASDLDAQLPLALALGEDPAPYTARPDFDLWIAVHHPTTRANEWRARIKAAPRLADKALLMGRILLPNPTSLTARLGHAPTAADYARESVARLRRGFRSSLMRRRGRSG